MNPKAVKYMQSLFAIKDSISKKESREISALFGISVAQVFFFISFLFGNAFDCYVRHVELLMRLWWYLYYFFDARFEILLLLKR